MTLPFRIWAVWPNPAEPASMPRRGLLPRMPHVGVNDFLTHACPFCCQTYQADKFVHQPRISYCPFEPPLLINPSVLELENYVKPAARTPTHPPVPDPSPAAPRSPHEHPTCDHPTRHHPRPAPHATTTATALDWLWIGFGVAWLGLAQHQSEWPFAM